MILRSVKVQGMRCFRNQVSVGLFGEGLNLVYAPNETGKSTLIEGVSRALFDRYSVGGRDIEALRPWGTHLCPEIELEFEVDEQRYRLHKRLLDEAACTLEEMRNGSWTLLAERDQADDFVRNLLHGDLPGRGPTKLEHRGLARTLWCLQEPGAERTYAVSSAVADQLRAALPGEIRISARSDALAERVGELYEEHFTPAGRVKRHSQVDELESDAAGLAERRREAQAACEEVDSAAQQFTEISQQLEQLQGEKDGCERRIEQYEQEVQALRELRAEIAALESATGHAERNYQNAARDLERYQDAERLADGCTDALQDVKRRLEEEGVSVKMAQALVGEARQELQNDEEARKRASKEWERARKTNRALKLRQENEQLIEQENRLHELEAQLQEDQRELEAMPCPGDEQIAEARQLGQQIIQLQAQLEVAGLQAEVQVSQDQEVRLAGGGEPFEKELVAGEAVSYHAGALLQIELPEVARITVTSGAAEPTELAAGLEKAREALQALLAPFAADDPDVLQRLLTEFQARQEKLLDVQKEIERAADPYDDVEEVRTAQARTTVEFAQLLNELQLSENELAAMTRQNEEALERALGTFQAAEDRIREQLHTRREQYDDVREKHQDLVSEQMALESENNRQLTVMETVLEGAECADVDALRRRAGELEAQLDTAQDQLEEKRAELPPPETDPEKLLGTQKVSLEHVERRERELLDGRGSVRGIIDRARTEGRYERLSQIEEELDATQKKLGRVQQKAQAVKLLRQVLAARREATVSGQLPGLEETITRMLRHITGQNRPVHMGSDLRVEGVAAETDPTVRRIDDLSAGIREQLDLVARIALGETYAEHYGRTTMVLDDVLLYTDPMRHDRGKEILKRAASLLQIFILTSDPSRYRGIVDPQYQFDLTQLVV